MSVRALVGTRKGLFVFHGDDRRREWRLAGGPLLAGWVIFHATVDPRTGTLYAAANHFVYGPTVQRSTDRGKTWQRSQQIRLPEGSDELFANAWHVEPGRPDEPTTLHLRGD